MNARKSSAAKKPSKKAAKKAYSPPKKPVPRLKRMTLEEFVAAMDERDARADARMAASQARMAATEAELAKSRKEADARMAESHARWEVEHAKTEAAHRKTEAALKRLSDHIDQVSDNVDKVSEAVDKGVGGLRISIGSITEMVLLPGLAAKMRVFGHIFTKSSHNNLFKRADGSRLAEVDLYLENCGSVMVVEAKTLFDGNGVNGLLERVGKLRANEKLAGVENKTIYAAAAGVDFTAEARRMIKDNGIYLVQISEDNDRIDVESLPIDEAGKW